MMPATGAPDPVPDDLLDDLRRRLRATRRARLPRGLGWERGTDEDYLGELLDHWADGYDWRAHEARIRDLPWAESGVTGMRFVHQRTSDPQAPVVVLLHGWPDSVLRFVTVLPLLDDVHVVVPALPGYPFAPPHTERGMSPVAMAEVVAATMADLGHERYVVSGGDIGTGVADALASNHPERVVALHLTDLPFRRLADVPEDEITEDEAAYQAAVREWQSREGGYAHEQSTKPHTLAVGLTDSPAGLAAWIVEKLRSWTDCHGDVETVFDRDDLLTWVMAYWTSGAIGTSFSPYVEPRESLPPSRRPAVVQQFPADLMRGPRHFADRFLDVREWLEPARGGHFAAWEQPAEFVIGVRAALAISGSR